MLNKPLEYWAVLIGMVLYAAARDAEREALWRRLAKTGASGFLAVGLSPDVAPYLRNSETLATVAIMAFGMIVLDVVTALLQDRAFIKDLIRKRLGGGPTDGQP
jgi:hypothetical protein